MYPRIRPIVAAAVVLVLCRAPAHQGAARIIRDGKDRPTNPAVEAGGYPLPFRRDDTGPLVIPYSLIGAIWAENRWLPPCIVWPWRIASPFPMYLPNVIGRTAGALPRGPGIWVPPRAP